MRAWWPVVRDDAGYRQVMGEARYDDVAATYGVGPDDYSVGATAALVELVGDVRGLRVADLACGHGPIARELGRRGAAVVGVDLSDALIQEARAREVSEPLGIDYVVADVSSTDTLQGEQFDLLVCNFGLSDIDDLDGCCATASRLLVSGGAFVWSILHPCFPGGAGVSGSWPSDGSYQHEGWWRADGEHSGLRQVVGAHHRRVSTYVNTMGRHALFVDAVAEPGPEHRLRTRSPELATVPLYLVIRCSTP